MGARLWEREEWLRGAGLGGTCAGARRESCRSLRPTVEHRAFNERLAAPARHSCTRAPGTAAELCSAMTHVL